MVWLLLRETVRQLEQRGQTVVDVRDWIREVVVGYGLTKEHRGGLVQWDLICGV